MDTVRQETYRYQIRHLLKAFDDAGIPKSASWIYRQERKGNLVLPKSTTDIKSPTWKAKRGAVRIFTRRHINDIVNAFLPGGAGKYSYL